MKYVFLITALLWSSSWNDIARQNRLRRQARALRMAGQYAEALQKYNVLIDSMGVRDLELRINRAHTWYSLGNKTQARSAYQELLTETSGATRAMVLNQWAISLPLPQERTQALDALQEAMRLDPTNENARYNYQWILHQKEDKQESPSDPNKDSEKEDNSSDSNPSDKPRGGSSDKDEASSQEESRSDSSSAEEKKPSASSQGKEDAKDASGGEEERAGEEDQESADAKAPSASSPEVDQDKGDALSSSKESLDEEERLSETAQKLSALQLTPAQAKRLLEALRTGEVQYLQQRRRTATQPQADDKPDW